MRYIYKETQKKRHKKRERETERDRDRDRERDREEKSYWRLPWGMEGHYNREGRRRKPCPQDL